MPTSAATSTPAVNKALTGQYDAVILAQAGLIRAGMTDVRYTVLSVDQVLPAPGQAALALQGRTDDAWLRNVLAPVNDPVTAACLQAERRMLQALHLDCQMPFAAFCESQPGGYGMRAWLADPRTGRSLRVEAAALAIDPLVAEVVRRIDEGGGQQLLDGCRHRA